MVCMLEKFFAKFCNKKYKFYGQFEEPVDKFIFERYFKNKKDKGVCIESGAFDGVTECSCKFFEETLGWEVYNIEPVPYIYDKLCKNRPDSHNFQFALSDNNGEQEFCFPIHPILGKDFGNGSLEHFPAHKKELEDSNCTFETLTVKTLTYKNFIESNNIKHIDVFVLDVEGAELRVLEGMKNCDVLPEVFCIEYGNAGLDVIKEKLAEFGYSFDTVSYANAYFIKKH